MFKKGYTPYNKGKKRDRPKDMIWREKRSQEMKGKQIKNAKLDYWKGKKQPKEMVEKRKMFGDKNPKWKGGITTENRKLRKSIEWRLWRESVFARDNWTCQECGKRDGSELHPHHIKSFADYPELRFAIDNGITLCVSCHLKTGKHKRIVN